MDQEKIGKFILEMRKQKGLTQKELAEKVGISDKTISKWECGNSMPDISYLEALCNSLEISVNELLSGQCLSEESYSEKAEENIMALMKENENNKKEGVGRSIAGILFALLGVTILAIACYGIGGLSVFIYFVDWVGLGAMFLLCVAGVLLSGKKEKVDMLRALQKIVIPNGVLLSMIQFILMLTRLDDISAVGPSIAIMSLEIVYGVVTYLIVTLLLERSE